MCTGTFAIRWCVLLDLLRKASRCPSGTFAGGVVQDLPDPLGPAEPGLFGRVAYSLIQLLQGPRRRWFSAAQVTWSRFGSLLRADDGVAGNLVPDALLASLALAHGCRLATADRGFARYPGLTWFDPAQDQTPARP